MTIGGALANDIERWWQQLLLCPSLSCFPVRRTGGCYYTSRAVCFFPRGRILYSEYCFGDFLFFLSLRMGGVGLVFKRLLLFFAEDGQDLEVRFVLRSGDDNVGFSPSVALRCSL